MTPGERIYYHTKLWPDACLAIEWHIKYDARRRQVALDCMQLVGGPLVTTSSPFHITCDSLIPRLAADLKIGAQLRHREHAGAGQTDQSMLLFHGGYLVPGLPASGGV